MPRRRSGYSLSAWAIATALDRIRSDRGTFRAFY